MNFKILQAEENENGTLKIHFACLEMPGFVMCADNFIITESDAEGGLISYDASVHNIGTKENLDSIENYTDEQLNQCFEEFFNTTFEEMSREASLADE